MRLADKLPKHIKIEFRFLNDNLMVPAGHLLIFRSVDFKLMERRMNFIVRLFALTVLFSFRPAVVQDIKQGRALSATRRRKSANT